MKGVIFDIKEFSLQDGGGIRTTVFFKGCPLRCIWCHNPEGLSSQRELYVQPRGCTGCGLCTRPCTHADCAGLGRCLHVCPKDLVRAVGEIWDSDQLAQHLMRGAKQMAFSGGGITLSGGEPLFQAAFAGALLDALEGRVHRAIETCGYAPREHFVHIARRCELVMMDLKLFDEKMHLANTGVSNAQILENARWLKSSGIEHVFRIPLIPGITDTRENLAALAAVAGASRVELLSYNRLAPVKYAGLGRRFTDKINPENTRDVDLTLFQNAVLKR